MLSYEAKKKQAIYMQQMSELLYLQLHSAVLKLVNALNKLP